MSEFVDIIINILALLVTLGILVTIHEYGHYWVAKRCGVRVERFSIGFGKPLFRWRGKPDSQIDNQGFDDHKGTEFVIAALPLGGYVKMLGEHETEVPDEQKHLAFSQKPLQQKAAIVAAGPIANFLLAIVIYWFLFIYGVSGVAPVIGKIIPGSTAEIAGLMAGDEIISVDGDNTRTWQEVRLKLLERLGESGTLAITASNEGSSSPRSVNIQLDKWLINASEPDALADLGIQAFRLDIPAVMGEIIAGGRAEAAGLEVGDEIISVNQQSVIGWIDWVEIIRANPDTAMDITVDRAGQIINLTITPESNDTENGEVIGYIGAGVQQPEVMPLLPESMNRSISYSPVSALPKAIEETWDNSVFILDSVRKMIIRQISVENISGPFTIADIAGETASYGLEYFVGFLAILSITLGVMNLLPIPVLDGGHLLYYAIEAVIRRPVPRKIQEYGMQVGLIIIAGIMFLAFFNDLNRYL